MKKCSVSLIITKMHIKTPMRCHLTPGRMATINKSTNKCWRGCGQRGIFLRCGWECRLVQPLWKAVWSFLKKLKMGLPFDPAIPLLGLHPKNPETPIRKHICALMFIVALFTIVKIWKQPKCPSVGEWVKKLWCIYTVEFYMAVKKRRNSYLLQQHGWTWRS